MPREFVKKLSRRDTPESPHAAAMSGLVQLPLPSHACVDCGGELLTDSPDHICNKCRWETRTLRLGRDP